MFSKMQYERLGISLKVLGNCELNKHQFMTVCCSSNIKHISSQLPGVVMFNHASVDFEVKAGDRIAQLVCERIAYPEIQVNIFCANASLFQRFGYFSLAMNGVDDEVLILGIGFIKSRFDLFVIGSLRKQLIAGVGKPRCD